MTYRAEPSSRALGQLGGFPEAALSALVVTMADVTGSPDDRLRTFPTGDPHVRRAEFGDAGPVTYLIDDASATVTVVDVSPAAVSGAERWSSVINDHEPQSGRPVVQCR